MNKKKKIREGIKIIIQNIKKVYLSFRSNHDLLVFLMFFFLATILWFLNALRKDYTAEISYPVTYSDFPEGYILLGKPTAEVQLKIHSSGYNVLPYFFGKILTSEELNVSSFKRYKKNNKQGAFILTRELLKEFSDNMANGIQLVEIYPDTLFVDFEKIKKKKVPVVFKSKLNFKDQHYQAGKVIVKPDSVEISGPATYIDTIKYISTINKTYNELGDSLISNLSLVSYKNVKSNPDNVVVKVPIQPFAEKNIKVPIEVRNLPDSLNLKCFPSDISVSFIAAINKYNELYPSDFKVIVDFNKIDKSKGLPDRIKVGVIDYPEGIKNLSYSPLFVECLFELK